MSAVAPSSLPSASLPANRPLPAQAAADYSLAVPQDARRALARGWLWLGLFALVGSGLFSILLVLSRTPGVNRLLPAADFFHTSLVLHVDLSVLVWFMAMAGLLWSVHGSGRAMRWAWAALWTCAAGTLAMAVAPFVGAGEPIMANYIPVLSSPLFLGGLVAFGRGVGMLALRFTWTLLMLVGWLWLANACGARLRLSPRVTLFMFALALAGVFVTPWAYLAHDISSVEHRALLTWAMRAGGGTAIVPVALAVVVALYRLPLAHATQHPLRAALLASILLFGAGGVIGIFISGSNVRIPAHYHGCIVGVTLALMGLVYHLLPALGYAAPKGRLAVAQPWVYGLGQLMHIVGLVWSGGYGVQRKVAGAEQVLRSNAEIAGMGLMGFGGLVAIIGGVLFIVVTVRAMRTKESAGTPVANEMVVQQ